MAPSRKLSTESVGTKQWQNYPAQASAEKNKMTGSDTMLRYPVAEVKRKISDSSKIESQPFSPYPVTKLIYV